MKFKIYTLLFALSAIAFISCKKDKGNDAYANLSIVGIQTRLDTSEVFHLDLGTEQYRASEIETYRTDALYFDKESNTVGYSNLNSVFTVADRPSVVPLQTVKQPYYLSHVVYDYEKQHLVGMYYDNYRWHIKVLDTGTGELIAENSTGLSTIVPEVFAYNPKTGDYFIVRSDDEMLLVFDPLTATVKREIQLAGRMKAIKYAENYDMIIGLSYESGSDDIYIDYYGVATGELRKSIIFSGERSYRTTTFDFLPERDEIVLQDTDNNFCFISLAKLQEVAVFFYDDKVDEFIVVE